MPRGAGRSARMRFRFTIASVLVLAAAGVAAAQNPRPAGVLLIFADGLGTGDLQGNPVVKTPALDALAAESVRITDFHGQPQSVPARAELLTGRHPSKLGVHAQSGLAARLAAPSITLSSVMAKADWHCGIIGTWGLGTLPPCRPQDHGFSFSLVHGGPQIASLADAAGNDGTDDTLLKNGAPHPTRGWCMDVWKSAAAELIARPAGEGPWFCLLAPAAPRSPWQLPPDKALALPEGARVPLPEFAAHVREVDSLAGSLIEALRNSGKMDEVLIIFTSTTGTALGWDDARQLGYNRGLRGTAGQPLEGGHRVPFLARWPRGGIGGPGKGRDVRVLASHADLLPTIAGLCGAALPADAGLDGRSLEPLLRGDTVPAEWKERLVIAEAQDGPRIIPWRRSAVMQGPWRLVNGRELYRVDTDPGQRSSMQAAHPDIFASLRAAGEAHWKVLAAPAQAPAAWKLETQLDLSVEDAVSLEPATTILQADLATGRTFRAHWPIEPATEADWVITLRRWPPGTDRAISDGLFPVKEARLLAGKLDLALPVPPDAREISFRVRLPAGRTDLHATFRSETGAATCASFLSIAPPPPEPEKKRKPAKTPAE